jgi:cytochrome c biogenesis protein CcmG, thiol:disulfide interchange protein DsbE
VRAARCLAAGLAVSAAAWAHAAIAPIKSWTGKATPALALPDLTGKQVDLKDLRGRVVVVNFWATWCEPCRDEMPGLVRLREQFRDRPLEVLAVNFGESNAKIAGFLEREKIALPVLLDADKEAAARWNAKGLPMTFLVDATGRVRYWVFGERDWSEGEALRHVEKLLAEASVARR